MTRLYLSRVLKVVFVVSTASFLFIQVQISRHDRRHSSNGSEDSSHPVAPLLGGGGVNGTLLLEPFPGNVNLASLELPSPTVIRQLIEDNNLYAEVLNEDRYGPVNQTSVVLVVQVHNRPKYLDKLIQSLAGSRDISKTLLIFSHDFYSDELNQLIRNIRFCRVMQIFYPYPIQIFPDRFPGQDPRDCPTNVGREKAKEIGCQNWAHPDKYGHYRSAAITQIKHHWWWKINFVFDGIPKLRNFDGHVLFLEEDHYVSPDFLHVLKLMVENKHSYCSECSIIALGFYLKSYGNYANTMSQLAVFPWFSSRHNMGMAIDRVLWNKIRDCSKLFCVYDDYNWDWSLMHINLKCMKNGPMTVLYAKSPRVLHIGDCGIHHQGKQCTADASATKVSEILAGAKKQLFPDSLTVGERSRRTLKPPKENGGWGDLRDHYLCLNHTLWHVQRTVESVSLPIAISSEGTRLKMDVNVNLTQTTELSVVV